MWGGPTPHNLVTLSLCCAVRTCSEVPITSSDRDTTKVREGRPHSPSLGHPCPGAGSSFTQREVPLRLGIRSAPQRHQTRRRITPGIPPILAVTRKDYGSAQSLPSSLLNARLCFHVIHPHLIIQHKVSFSSHFISFFLF